MLTLVGSNSSYKGDPLILRQITPEGLSCERHHPGVRFAHGLNLTTAQSTGTALA